jgi:hypothetical protein
MVNISLILYTKDFFGSVLKSPTQMGSLSKNNSVTNSSRLGTFKTPSVGADCNGIFLGQVFHTGDINLKAGDASIYHLAVVSVKIWLSDS